MSFQINQENIKLQTTSENICILLSTKSVATDPTYKWWAQDPWLPLHHSSHSHIWRRGPGVESSPSWFQSSPDVHLQSFKRADKQSFYKYFQITP